MTSLPESSVIAWNVAMSLYAASKGTSAIRGYRSRVSTGSTPPLAARTTSAPSVGSPTRPPSFATASEERAIGSMYWSSDASGSPATRVDLPGRRVALARDREAPPADRHLDGGHLVERQRARLVRVDRRRRAQRLHRAQPLHDRAGLGQRRRAGREDRRDHRREAGRDRRHGERDGGQEQLVERLPAGQPEADRDRQRDARDHEDLVGQRVELLGQRRLVGRLGVEHARDVADLGATCRSRSRASCRRRA